MGPIAKARFVMGLTTVVATTPGREKWLAQCITSLFARDVLVVSLEHGYELGKIQWVYEHTDIERFLFLQDSVEVLSDGFWARLNEFDGSVALLSDPDKYGSYMGVYERSILQYCDWPDVSGKADSIAHEIMWTRDYCARAGDIPVMFPELRDAAGFETERFGRNNLVLENQYFRKWKGTWK